MNADRIIDAGHAMYHGAIVRKLERELADARQQRDRLAQALESLLNFPNWAHTLDGGPELLYECEDAIAAVKGGNQ
jgi:hypothetical protein